MSPKKRPNTPRSMIRSALRRLWMRSRERVGALKREKYTCQGCGRKQSKAKGREFSVDVHHAAGINWEGVIDIIAKQILQDESKLVVLCQTCHDKEHPEMAERK